MFAMVIVEQAQVDRVHFCATSMVPLTVLLPKLESVRTTPFNIAFSYPPQRMLEPLILRSYSEIGSLVIADHVHALIVTSVPLFAVVIFSSFYFFILFYFYFILLNFFFSVTQVDV